MADFTANGTGNIALECQASNGATALKAVSDTSYCISAQSDDSYAIAAQSITGTCVNATSALGIGVFGQSDRSVGVFGQSNSGVGVFGQSDNASGVVAQSQTGSGIIGTGAIGIEGYSTSTTGVGIIGHSPTSGQGFAGKFLGDVDVQGTLTKSAGTFKIDHPLDPSRKYLTHAFVEAAEMKNLYDGIAVLDDEGAAMVELPCWFEALNASFRYQLTCIGDYAPVYIAQKIQNNCFKIAGGKPGMEVSWLVTGIRHDPYALAHAFTVEEEKSEQERGYYRHPELYGESEERGIAYVQFSEKKQQLTDQR